MWLPEVTAPSGLVEGRLLVDRAVGVRHPNHITVDAHQHGAIPVDNQIGKQKLVDCTRRSI